MTKEQTDAQAALEDFDIALTKFGYTNSQRLARVLKHQETIRRALSQPCVDVGALRQAAMEVLIQFDDPHYSRRATHEVMEDLREALSSHSTKPIDWDGLIEGLADIEHERWSGWMKYFYENDTPENNERWRKQMVTPYKDLPEHSKESDRREVRKSLAYIKKLLEGEEGDR